MSKVLNYAGISRVAGELKFRTATEDSRFLQLVKLGDTDVEFIKIDPVESKSAAAQQLLDRGFNWDKPEVLALLSAVATNAKTPRERTVKVQAVKKVKEVAVKEKRLTVDQANARVLATVREMDPARELELRVFKMIKQRKRRVKTTEAV